MTTQQLEPRTETVSVKTIRRACLECSGGSMRHVLWCPCDGHNSTDCEFWASRFGVRPETFIGRNGPYLLTPEIMPGAEVDLRRLPHTVAAASEWLRERHPEIEWDGPREKTPEEIARADAARARMKALNSAASPESTSLETGASPRKPK